MKTTPNRACPVPAWAFSLSFLFAELAFFAWLTRAGVARGLWSDLVGGLLFITLPFALRALICYGSYRIARYDFTQVAKDSLRARAFWRYFLIEYAHFCRQTFIQLPFAFLWRTEGDRFLHRPNGAVVLLQHGYAHSGAVWYATARALEQRGYRVYTIDQPMFAPLDTMADRLALRINEVLRMTGANSLTLVAHSMGGLIARAYLRTHGSASVNRVITLGSPHHGTRHAMLAGGSNGKQMRLRGEWLAGFAEAPFEVSFVSIYSIHDTVISPGESSRLSMATNIELARVGHVSMPSGRLTREALIEQLPPP